MGTVYEYWWKYASIRKSNALNFYYKIFNYSFEYLKYYSKKKIDANSNKKRIQKKNYVAECKKFNLMPKPIDWLIEKEEEWKNSLRIIYMTIFAHWTKWCVYSFLFHLFLDLIYKFIKKSIIKWCLNKCLHYDIFKWKNMFWYLQ